MKYGEQLLTQMYEPAPKNVKDNRFPKSGSLDYSSLQNKRYRMNYSKWMSSAV